jgi:hypothetical protein
MMTEWQKVVVGVAKKAWLVLLSVCSNGERERERDRGQGNHR